MSTPLRKRPSCRGTDAPPVRHYSVPMRLRVLVLVTSLLLAACASSESGGPSEQPSSPRAAQSPPSPPPPDEPIPRDPGRLAKRLAGTTAALYGAIDRLRSEG